jgi:hypothetical protein
MGVLLPAPESSIKGHFTVGAGLLPAPRRPMTMAAGAGRGSCSHRPTEARLRRKGTGDPAVSRAHKAA